MPRTPKNTPAPVVDTPPEGAPEVMAAGEFNPTVHALLLQANDLRTEKKDHLERVEANRSSLRMLKRTGLLSEDQSKAIDQFYPPNTRKQNQPQDSNGNGADAQPDAPAADATPDAA